jgi:hypothetical protein
MPPMVLRALALLAVLAAATTAAAAEPPTPRAGDVSRARAEAMGNAFRAVSTSNEALFFNLAGMAMARRYALDGAYALNPGSDLRQLSFSVVDSKTSPIAAGAAYTNLRGDGLDGRVKGSIANLGIAVPLGGFGALGFGGKYLSFDRPDPTTAVTADVGLLVRLAGSLTAGAAAYNVIDVGSAEAPFGAGAGLSYGDDTSWRLAGDVALDLSRKDRTPATLAVGGEYLVAGAVPLRVGFHRDVDASRTHVSAGLGFVTPTFGADFAFVQGLDPDVPSDRTFSFTLELFL